MPQSLTDRKTVLADAAIEVIDDLGLRGLTHRATERRAGLPEGTCSHHFPTRRDLISAVLVRIDMVHRADIERFSDGQLSPDIDRETLVEGTSALLVHWLGPGRARSRVEMLLMLDPSSRELATPTMMGLSQGMRTLAATITGDDHVAGLVVSLVYGFLYSELTSGSPLVDPDRMTSSVTLMVQTALAGRSA